LETRHIRILARCVSEKIRRVRRCHAHVQRSKREHVLPTYQVAEALRSMLALRVSMAPGEGILRAAEHFTLAHDVGLG
jgi:hypothetical protein